MAEQLHGHLVLAGREAQQMARLLVGVGEPLRRHHLGEGEVGPLLAAEGAERLVAHARHGRQQDPMLPEVIEHAVYAHATNLA